MYSGTTLNNKSGAIFGAHQKIDRVAFKNLHLAASIGGFPDIQDILYFEGKNGPDGIKRKSPSKDEPKHFYDPFDETDTQLVKTIQTHYSELVKHLQDSDRNRAAFDASWVAHAVVDGLTPAHHFPYEQRMGEIRGDTRTNTQDTVMNRVVAPGDTLSEKLRANWAVYGAKGVLSQHGFFEFGVAAILAPIKMTNAQLTTRDIDELSNIGYIEVFQRAAREIASFDMYSRFCSKGWTVRLTRDVRNHLGPIMARTVGLVWYSAAKEAGLTRS